MAMATQQAPGDENSFTFSKSPSHSSSPLTPPSHPNPPHPTPTSSCEDKPVMMNPPIADVDDAAGFMAAARTLKLNNYGTPSVGINGEGNEKEEATGHDSAEPGFESTDEANPITMPASDELIGKEFPGEKDVPGGDSSAEKGPDIAASVVDLTIDSDAHTPQTEAQPEVHEDREQLTTFTSWGTPAVRDKPAAKVRRVIIRGLPSSWSTPDKVLSLVHGGVVESVTIGPSGNAHVLFCDPAACKAYYDKYPNGIDLDKERKFTVLVDMGQDVDVISSQLEFNLSVGSTRVVRAVGVGMNTTMNELVKIATASGRKVEKIIDSYVPGLPRSVNFRFCSIEDAVRFRAALVRNEDWEQCNVQYGTDPCEVATGYHAD
ncbi:hypothetical protein BJX61DRAFT_384203 [Aspergillus egyptiacus]|nr:hypothetical protein BJX61DRAFT_384203 [Aspergillus egyptiacus]